MKSKDQQLLEEAYDLIILNELFDSPYPYVNMGTTGHNRVFPLYTKYSFCTSNQPFPRFIVHFTLEKRGPELEIIFTYQEDESSIPVMNLTGKEKNGSRVISTVMAITKQYLTQDLNGSQLKALEDGEIKFSAKKAERGKVKMYDSLANLMVRYLDQIQMYKENNVQWGWKIATDDLDKYYIITSNKKDSQISKKENELKSSLKKFLTPS